MLVPFFRDAPAALWPGLIVIEDSSAEWSADLFAVLASKGYEVSSRTKQNVMLRRGSANNALIDFAGPDWCHCLA